MFVLRSFQTSGKSESSPRSPDVQPFHTVRTSCVGRSIGSGGEMTTKGLPRRLTMIGEPVRATRSQMLLSLVLASKMPMDSMPLNNQKSSW